MFYRNNFNKRDQFIIILPALPCLYSPSGSKNIFHETINNADLTTKKKFFVEKKCYKANKSKLT